MTLLTTISGKWLYLLGSRPGEVPQHLSLLTWIFMHLRCSAWLSYFNSKKHPQKILFNNEPSSCHLPPETIVINWWWVDFMFPFAYILSEINFNKQYWRCPHKSVLSYSESWLVWLKFNHPYFKQVADILSAKSPFPLPNDNWSPLLNVSPALMVPPDLKLSKEQ